MSIRCFVSSLVDFTTLGGSQRYIASVIDGDFTIRDGKLFAVGFSSLRADLGEDYTKAILIEVSYSKDAKKWGVNVFWDHDWIDWKGLPMSQYDREKASGVCALKVAEEKAIKFFQKEAEEMLERIIYYHWDEIKQVLRA